MMMEEQAKEELRNLEVQYPNSYEYLKLELKSFIFFLQSPDHHTNSTAATQESTNDRKRKKMMSAQNHCVEENEKQEFQNQSPEHIAVTETNISSRKLGKRRDRVEVVLGRAQACLRKIRLLKTSLLS